MPKLNRVVMIPISDVNARSAALLSNQVDLIEAPAPDAVASIKARGFKISTSQSAHLWAWEPSLLQGSPWRDVRVRQAANLCIDLPISSLSTVALPNLHSA